MVATADAGFGEKGRSRLVQWNGYRDQEWQIWARTVGLRFPKLWTGPYSLSVAATNHPKHSSQGRRDSGLREIVPDKK